MSTLATIDTQPTAGECGRHRRRRRDQCNLGVHAPRPTHPPPRARAREREREQQSVHLKTAVKLQSNRTAAPPTVFS